MKIYELPEPKDYQSFINRWQSLASRYRRRTFVEASGKTQQLYLLPRKQAVSGTLR